MEVVGDGASRPEGEAALPLDVPYNKMADWLSDRKLLPTDWPIRVRRLSERVSMALAALPDLPQLQALKMNAVLNYQACCEVADILAGSAEEGGRKWWGGYKSSHTKEWAGIVSSYKANNLFLAEAAEVLVRDVSYEVPYYKKIIAKAQAQIEELHRKAAGYSRSAKIYKGRFSVACSNLHIDGQNLREELLASTGRLPNIFNEAAAAMREKSFLDAVTYFEAYIQYTSKGGCSCAMLPSVQRVCSQASFEFKWSSNGATEVVCSEMSGTGGDGIDWGDMDVTAAAATSSGDGIDWGDMSATDPPVDGGGDGIDWGDDTAAESTSAGIDWGENDGAAVVSSEGGIDWGDVEVASSEPVEVNAVVSVEESGSELETAEGLFQSEEHRNILVAELNELFTFLSQRIVEIQEVSDLSASESLAGGIHATSSDELEAMREAVRVPLNLVSSSSTEQLLLVRGSKVYLDRMVKTLSRLSETAEKLENSRVASAQACTSRIPECEKRSADAASSIGDLKATVRKLQVQVEHDIGRLTQRAVRLVGTINTL